LLSGELPVVEKSEMYASCVAVPSTGDYLGIIKTSWNVKQKPKLLNCPVMFGNFLQI
jgi:hypothetical protein